MLIEVLAALGIFAVLGLLYYIWAKVFIWSQPQRSRTEKN